MPLCPHCQTPAVRGRFCTACGYDLTAPVPAAPVAAAAPAPSHRHVLVGVVTGVLVTALLAGGGLTGYRALAGSDHRPASATATTPAAAPSPAQAAPPTPAAVSGSGSAGSAPRVSQPSAPWVSITCPSDGYGVAPARLQFGYRYQAAAAPARVVVDYGDGNSYTTDRADWIKSAFWHDYQPGGSYNVSVRLIDALGREAVDSCTFAYEWDGVGD